MTYKEAYDAIQGKTCYANVVLKDGTKVKKHLFCTETGMVCEFKKGSRKYGHYAATQEWLSVKPVQRREVDITKLFRRRAARVIAMTAESGFWTKDIRKPLEHLMEMHDIRLKEILDTDFRDYIKHQDNNEPDYKLIWEVMDQLASSHGRSPIVRMDKSYNAPSIDSGIAKAVAEKGEYHSGRFQGDTGYDISIDVIHRNDEMEGSYSMEYRNCLNGHYYLMLDKDHAIFYQDD